MMITNCARQCILSLKQYSDKKTSSQRRPRTQLLTTTTGENDDHSDTDELKDTAVDINQDSSLLKRLLNCKPCRTITDHQQHRVDVEKRNWEDSEANLYWKYKAKEYYTKSLEADKVQEKLDNVSNTVTNVQKDIDVQRKSLREINDRVVVLERLMIDSHILLEKIRSTVQHEDKSLPERHKFIHILSRDSPYIFTNEPRFPVTERHIPWVIPFDLYDPTEITLSKNNECFQDSVRPFVEPNLLTKLDNDEELQLATDISAVPPSPIVSEDLMEVIDSPAAPVTNNIIIPSTDYRWNATVELQLSDGRKMIIDRVTWIASSEDNEPPVYKLDKQLSIPLNPMGRTGVRGRGALIRWGPNKSIMAVITRWKTHRGQFAIIEGQRILETLVFKNKNTNDWKLPGGRILGVESPYGAVCRSFHKLAFNDHDSEHSQSFQEIDMIHHFKSFARSSLGILGPDGFESHMVYRGYIDDLRNTDNAWVEAEIWNFHYGAAMAFPDLRTDGMALWKDVTINTRGFLIQTSILREIARIHDAYFE